MLNVYDIDGNMAKLQEPFGDDIPIVSITGSLPTAKSQGEINVVVEYKSATTYFVNYAKVKVQGDSSAEYPKKNFTVKLFSDIARQTKAKHEFMTWDKPRDKFVLKANWIDHSHARNIVNARLWTQIVKARSDFDSLPSELKNSNIAIDGFAVKVYNNGIYMGLYTWNLPKDSMYGLDDDVPENCIIQADGLATDSTLLFRSSTMDGKWADDLHNTMPSVIATSWNSVLNFVYTSSDTNFKNNLNQYIDKLSIIDVQIFLRCGCIVDNLAKNQTFFTYDAQQWYAGMYDMDGTWGLAPWRTAERGWLPTNTHFQTGYTAYTDGGHVTNLLHEKLWNLLKQDIKNRYIELRSIVLSADNIISEFEKFTSAIPPYLYEEDYASTTGEGEFINIPLVETNNILQLRDFVKARLEYCDEQVLNG